MTRHRYADTERGGAGGVPSSVPELGRLLRRARTRQGLRLEDVSARAGLPLAQLEALESGTVDRIPDRVTILKTLRRYADHLGLPGERYVIAMVDHWPAAVSPAPMIVPVSPQPLPLAVPVPATTTAGGWAAGGGQAGLAAAGAAGVTAGVPVTLAGFSSGVHPTTAQVPLTVVNTGVIPATPVAGRPGPRRQPGPPRALRLLVTVSAAAVVIGLGLLAVHRYEPGWLVSAGLTHSPGSTGGSPSSAGASSSGGSGTTTPGAGRGRQSPAPKPAVTTGSSPATLTLVSKTASSASFTVGSASFTVVVSAVGNASWAQATQPGKPAPTYAGVLQGGQSQRFTVQHSLTLVTGSVDGHVAVLVGGRQVGVYLPPAAPYTMTFQAAP